MKNGKLSALLNTPAGAVIAVATIIFGVELLIMLLIESLHATILKDVLLEKITFEFLDPILLIAIISPALYLLIFRPMRRQQVEFEVFSKKQAYQDWIAAMDTVSDLVFLHDQQLRIMRCNKAYQQCAGLPFKQIIGQPYYEVFPKTGAPLPCCQRAKEKAEEEEEVTVGAAIYRSRAYSIHDEQGAYLYSIHTLEDITEHKQAEDALRASTLKYQLLFESSRDALMMIAPPSWKFTGANQTTLKLFGASSVAEFTALGPWDVSPERQPDGRTSSEKAQEMIAIAMREGSHLFEWEHQRLDGQPFDADVLLTRMKVGGEIIVQATVRDITERKRAEALLQHERDFSDSMVDTAQVIILVLNPQGQIVRFNHYMEALTGYSLKEVEGQDWFSTFLPKPEREKTKELFLRALQDIQTRGNISALLTKDGQQRLIEWYDKTLKDAQGNTTGLLAIGLDVTERKQAELALSESERLYRSLFENMLNGFAYCQMIFEQDQPQDFIYLSVNAAFEAQTGLNNVVGKRVSEVIPGIRQSDPKLFEMYGRVSLSGKPERFEIYVEALQQWFWISVYSPGKGYFVAVFDVITERKRAEATLLESKDLLQSVVENAPIRVFWKDRDSRYLGCNSRFAKDAGRVGPDDLTGKTDFDMGWKDQAELYRADDNAVMESGIPKLDFEEPQTTPDGNTIWLRTSKVPLRDKSNRVIGILGIYEDITEYKQAEIAIQHANRALATLSAVNRNLVRATNEDELLQTICDAIVEQRDYRMAWVGYAQHDESKSIRIMARSGHDEGYLDTAQLTWAETEPGMRPCGYSIRSGATYVCQDIANDPLFLPWRDAALQRGYAASIALPLLNGDGRAFGTLVVYSSEANAFTTAEIALLEEMAGDLAFGVLTLHTRHERDLAQKKVQQQLVQLQDSLEDTVRAMAGLVEMRDPYTAGHQARVANLAAAIARQMGLPDEQVHAIHIAGTVHDLGKINIPAEVLSKPGKITAIEFNLIKTHPQAGYDILQGIDFPWPIAQMVLQHHERLDGSGYPQGLKGEAILLEARILAVADVVEAISAHRPYRAGFGIEIALAEITKNRGNYYAPQVVDACLALFREQHYTFKS